MLSPGADHGLKIKVAGLPGQRFLEKIQNVGRRFTLDWLECLAGKGHSIILLAHYIFWMIEEKLFSNAGYAAKSHKNA